MNDDKPNDKKIWSNDPTAPQNNSHHQGQYRSYQDWVEQSGFQGTADPDMTKYPGEDDPDYEPINKG